MYQKLFQIRIWVLALAPILVLNAAAGTTNFDLLSGTWDDLESFVTVGQCAGAPASAGLYLCSPAQIGTLKAGHLEAAGFVSATDSVIKVVDTLRHNDLKTDDINKLFSSYNYSEFLVSSRLSYVGKYALVGVRPVRMHGQFQVHNPLLPLASFAYKEDINIFAGSGFEFPVGDVHVSIGAQGTLVQRKEIIAEASLVEFGARPAAQLLHNRKLNGGFADLGATAELPNYFSVAGMIRDLGKFWDGEDISSQFLFIDPDKVPRFFVSANTLPAFWYGNFQIGAEIVGFMDRENDWNTQWFSTLSYFVGPFRVTSAIRPNLFRTGMAMKISGFDVSVAQEWTNKLEVGRANQPRFTLGIGASL